MAQLSRLKRVPDPNAATGISVSGNILRNRVFRLCGLKNTLTPWPFGRGCCETQVISIQFERVIVCAEKHAFLKRAQRTQPGKYKGIYSRQLLQMPENPPFLPGNRPV